MKFLHFPILLATLVSAITGEQGSGAGPFDRIEAFTSANQQPNATGTYSLFGVDMTFPPSQISTKAWTASVNLTEVSITTNSETSVQANTVIALNANGAWMSNSTDWGTCVVVMLDVSEAANKNGLDDPEGGNGSCTSVLGDECQNDWLEALRSARGISGRVAGNANSSVCNGIDMPSIPASCEGKFTLNTFAGDMRQNYAEGSGFFYQTSDSYDRANETSKKIYDAAATRIWPVVLIQGATYEFNKGVGLTFAQMVCLRANMTMEGSREVDDLPSLADGRLQSSLLVVVGGLIAITLLS